jgi:hypothetical protein
MPHIQLLTFHILNLLDILGFAQWIGSLMAWKSTGWLTGQPAPTAPQGLLISISIPDPLAIPTYMLNMILWGIGWAGAIFKYITIIGIYAIGNLMITVIELTIGMFTKTLSLIHQITAGMGILAIPIEILIIGIMLVLMIAIISSIIKLGQTIIEAL